MSNSVNKIEALVKKDSTNNQLSRAELVEAASRRNEGKVASNGAFTATTGKYTGRSPKDRFIVEDDVTRDTVDWGEVNKPISGDVFDALLEKVLNYLDDKEELFVFNAVSYTHLTLPTKA